MKFSRIIGTLILIFVLVLGRPWFYRPARVQALPALALGLAIATNPYFLVAAALAIASHILYVNTLQELVDSEFAIWFEASQLWTASDKIVMIKGVAALVASRLEGVVKSLPLFSAVVQEWGSAGGGSGAGGEKLRVYDWCGMWEIDTRDGTTWFWTEAASTQAVRVGFNLAPRGGHKARRVTFKVWNDGTDYGQDVRFDLRTDGVQWFAWYVGAGPGEGITLEKYKSTLWTPYNELYCVGCILSDDQHPVGIGYHNEIGDLPVARVEWNNAPVYTYHELRLIIDQGDGWSEIEANTSDYVGTDVGIIVPAQVSDLYGVQAADVLDKSAAWAVDTAVTLPIDLETIVIDEAVDVEVSILDSILNLPTTIVTGIGDALTGWFVPTDSFSDRWDLREPTLSLAFPLGLPSVIQTVTTGVFSGTNTVMTIPVQFGDLPVTTLTMEPPESVKTILQTISGLAAWALFFVYVLAMARRFLFTGG